MSEINYNETVTKGLLAAFGEKCKRLFNKLFASNSLNGYWLCINTNLTNYASFNKLDLYVEAITTHLLEKKFILFSSLFKSDSTTVNFAFGKNFGLIPILAAVLAINSENLLSILLKVSTEISFNDIVLKGSAFDINDKILPNYIVNVKAGNDLLDLGILLDDDTQEPIEYVQIAEPNKYPFSGHKIGGIITTAIQETNFTIVTDRYLNINNVEVEETKPYIYGATFDLIDLAAKAKKLNHTITADYDYNNAYIPGTSTAFNLGDLTANLTIILPYPKPKVNGYNSGNNYVNSVKVKDGYIIDATSDGITRATDSSFGGVKILDPNTIPVNDNTIWVKLTAEGKAFVDQSALISDKHRFDLNLLDAKDYTDEIYLHIGATSTDFINGYFYKSEATNGTFSLTSESTNLYTIASGFVSNLLTFINDKLWLSGNGIDLFKTPNISIHSINSSPTTWKLTNIDNTSDYIILSELELTTELGINYTTSTAPIETEVLYIQLTFDDAEWVLRNVQPASAGSGRNPITLYKTLNYSSGEKAELNQRWNSMTGGIYGNPIIGDTIIFNSSSETKIADMITDSNLNRVYTYAYNTDISSNEWVIKSYYFPTE